MYSPYGQAYPQCHSAQQNYPYGQSYYANSIPATVKPEESSDTTRAMVKKINMKNVMQSAFAKHFQAPVYSRADLIRLE